MRDANTTGETEAQAAVMEADDARHKAMVSGNLLALDQLLADGLIYTHATARRETKKEYMQSLELGRVRYLGVRRLTAALQLYGATAIMTGESEIHAISSGVDKTVQNMFQSVWMRKEELWQMVAWTSVLLPPVKGNG